MPRPRPPSRRPGAEALGVPTHLGELDDLAALVGATVDRFGGVDIVVNNAANAVAQPLGMLTPEAWDKSLSVNLRGPTFLVQEALPHLKESDHAAVVNVISVGAFLFGAYTSMYAAGKGGLLTMTRYMATEFAPLGIRVNALAPGSVDTDMVRNNTPEAQERMATASKMGRIATPDEMVGPVLFLAGDASSLHDRPGAGGRRGPGALLRCDVGTLVPSDSDDRPGTRDRHLPTFDLRGPFPGPEERRAP